MLRPGMDSAVSVSVLRKRSELGALAGACVELALDCAEPTRLEQSRSEGTRCVLVWIGEHGKRKLGALFPFGAPAPYRGLPLLAMSSCTPLVRAGCEELCLRALLDWFRLDGEGAVWLELRALARGRPVYRALVEVARQRDQLVLARGAGDGTCTLLIGDRAWHELASSSLPPLRWAKLKARALIHQAGTLHLLDAL